MNHQGLTRDEIKARAEAGGEVTPEEFKATVDHLDRWMVQHGHFPGTASRVALGVLAEAVAPDLALGILTEVFQFAQDNR